MMILMLILLLLLTTAFCVWLVVEGRESPRLVLSLSGEPDPEPES